MCFSQYGEPVAPPGPVLYQLKTLKYIGWKWLLQQYEDINGNSIVVLTEEVYVLYRIIIELAE